MTAHWSVPDPAAVEGTEAVKWAAFREAFHALEERIKGSTSPPIAMLDPIKLKQHLDEVGKHARPGASRRY